MKKSDAVIQQDVIDELGFDNGNGRFAARATRLRRVTLVTVTIASS